MKPCRPMACERSTKNLTEALILAAQDDCIYTHSFKVKCMGNAGDTHCRQCGEGVETVRHIPS